MFISALRTYIQDLHSSENKYFISDWLSCHAVSCHVICSELPCHVQCWPSKDTGSPSSVHWDYENAISPFLPKTYVGGSAFGSIFQRFPGNLRTGESVGRCTNRLNVHPAVPLPISTGKQKKEREVKCGFFIRRAQTVTVTVLWQRPLRVDESVHVILLH